MSCKEALIKSPAKLEPDQTVKEALDLLEEHQIRSAPVIDKNNNVVGMFGLHCLMEDILPIAAQIQDGLQDLDFIIGGGPGAAKKIRKISPNKVSDHMDTDIVSLTLHTDTPLLEVIRRLAKCGSPLPVIDKETGKFAGIVSEQSCLLYLHEVLKTVEEEENNE